jgi:hypothetical protein
MRAALRAKFAQHPEPTTLLLESPHRAHHGGGRSADVREVVCGVL